MTTLTTPTLPMTKEEYVEEEYVGRRMMEIFLYIPQEEFDHQQFDHDVFSFYVVYNHKNGKVYFGVHKENGKPYYGSGIRIVRSVNKNGKEHYTRFILAIFKTSQEAYQFEKFIVDKETLNDPFCYNLCGGGHGGASGELNCMYGVKGEDHHLYGIIPSKYVRDKAREATIKECIIGDTTFNSYKEAADYFGVAKSSITRCMSKPEDERLDFISKIISPNFTIDGMTFETVEEGAKYFDVAPVTFWRWANTPNKKIEDCIVKERKTHTINGIQFNSPKEAATHFNVTTSTIHRWSASPHIKRKIQGAQAGTRRCSIDGIQFNSLKEASKHFNVASPTISYWIKHPNKPDCYYL